MTGPCAIGGYFGLELPALRPSLHEQALRFQSARSAFFAFLQAHAPERVWMPHFICNAMLAPLAGFGIEPAFYTLDERFSIREDIRLAGRDLIVQVNYFGLCHQALQESIQHFGAEHVVCDNAQAFFCEPLPCIASVYSPRKFFGIPDGGLLVSPIILPAPARPDGVDPVQLSPLLKRLCLRPEDGYADFVAAERGFEVIAPRAMSYISEALLGAIDIAAVASRRRRNFEFLHARLHHLNRLPMPLPDGAVPLCYPLLPDRPGLRPILAAARIYSARYWPEVELRSPCGGLEQRLAQELIALPCDQRYEPDTLQRMVDCVEAYLR